MILGQPKKSPVPLQNLKIHPNGGYNDSISTPKSAWLESSGRPPKIGCKLQRINRLHPIQKSAIRVGEIAGRLFSKNLQNFLAVPPEALFSDHETYASAKGLCPVTSPGLDSLNQSLRQTKHLDKPNSQTTNLKPVMKPLTYAFLAAAAACSSAFGAATAYTTPVGYVTVDVPANGDTTITPPVERPTLYAAASTSISGNDIGATGLTAGAYVNPECYVQVTSGALSGQRFPVTANTATAITVSVPSGTLQSAGFVSGDTYKVVPFWTLNTMFPSGAGVGTSSDALNPTSFVFASGTGYGINKSSAVAYFYCSGDTENGVDPGWYDANDPFTAPLDNTRLDLSRMYTIRHTGSATTVTVTGQIPNVVPKIPVAVNTSFNDVLVGAPYPIDVTLDASGLQSAVQGSPDALNPVEYVFVYNDAASGINKAAAVAYFYCSGDAENGIDPGWYDSNDPFAGAITGAVVKAGRCVVIRKAPYVSPGTVTWTAPLPYSL